MSASRQKSFKNRYRGNWHTIATRTRRFSRNRCILNPFHKAEAVHHLRYRDIRGKIAGREVPGWDVVPLCRRCHGRVHRKQHWYSAKRHPALNNRQHWGVLWRLRLRFWLWAGVLNLWWVPALTVALATAWFTYGTPIRETLPRLNPPSEYDFNESDVPDSL
ncbi:MAG: hypothetical protein R6U67_11430 [Sodalinema sp.]|uniref:hypothetical protein n=1 Tax=Sodalinema sp. TaxID=3080550 RepID=UPI00121A0860|nr:MAG: hypothetical protein EYR95_04995 [Phormidium sp. SL48-SHIP]